MNTCRRGDLNPYRDFRPEPKPGVYTNFTTSTLAIKTHAIEVELM